jgi:signal transduction histidine kinase
MEEVKLPPAQDMSAYRVVQEALTNSLRHGGPGARATVTVRQSATDVVVEVVDDGLGAASPDASSVGGHGLLGMRERVGLFGGRLDAGPCPDGGYAVRAVLPVVAS